MRLCPIPSTVIWSRSSTSARMPLCAIGEVAPDFISAEIKSMVICIAELMGEILAASMGEIRAVCVRLCEKEAMVKMIFAA
mmetsp:Transcript_36997/g.97975  ORF Transcript_36997/g.97975 Transcript_36997/m.97975 type:complete len:81 (+) Transcript_36997:1701-1943(+)